MSMKTSMSQLRRTTSPAAHGFKFSTSNDKTYITNNQNPITLPTSTRLINNLKVFNLNRTPQRLLQVFHRHWHHVLFVEECLGGEGGVRDDED